MYFEPDHIIVTFEALTSGVGCIEIYYGVLCNNTPESYALSCHLIRHTMSTTFISLYYTNNTIIL